MRDLLYAPQDSEPRYCAEVIDDMGRVLSHHAHDFGGERAGDIFIRSKGVGWHDTGNCSAGTVIVHRDVLAAMIEGRVLRKTESQSKAGVADAEDLPPYLSFMIFAASELNLPSQMMTKDSIADWLDEHWPADLDGKSNRMIDAMATLLRSPDAKKGGYFKG